MFVIFCSLIAEAPAMQIVQATGAIDFLVELKMQDNDSMQRMAEKTLSCLLKFDGERSRFQKRCLQFVVLSAPKQLSFQSLLRKSVCFVRIVLCNESNMNGLTLS